MCQLKDGCRVLSPAVRRSAGRKQVEPKPHTQAALPASWFVNPAFASQGGTCHGPKPNLFFGFGCAGDQLNVNSRSLTSRGTLPKLGWVVSAFDQLCYVTASEIIFLELSQGPEMFQEALSHLSHHGFPFVFKYTCGSTDTFFGKSFSASMLLESCYCIPRELDQLELVYKPTIFKILDIR